MISVHKDQSLHTYSRLTRVDVLMDHFLTSLMGFLGRIPGSVTVFSDLCGYKDDRLAKAQALYTKLFKLELGDCKTVDPL